MNVYVTAVVLMVGIVLLLGGLIFLALQFDRWRFQSKNLPIPSQAKFIDNIYPLQHNYTPVTTLSHDMHHYTFQREDTYILLPSEPIELCLQGTSSYPSSFSGNDNQHSFVLMPEIHFSGESTDERLGKKLALIKEFQTGDAEFDESVFIDTNVSLTFLDSLLSSDILRTAILDLLGSGWSTVTIFGHFSPVSMQAIDTSILSPDRAPLDTSLDTLRIIQSQLPSISVQNPKKIAYDLGDKLLLANIILGLGAIAISLLGRDQWIILNDHFLEQSLLLSIIIWILTIPIFFRFLRGYSFSLKAFASNTCLMLFSLVLGCNPFLRWINAQFDDSPIQEVVVEILEKPDVPANISYTYIGIQKSEFTPATTILISQEQLASLDNSVHLQVRSGALSEVWLVQIGPPGQH